VGFDLLTLSPGRNRGKGVHGRYFQLKNWSGQQQQDWLHKHAGPYTAFGLVATLLEMVPIVSIAFSFTNAGKNTTRRPKLFASWNRAATDDDI
jgi:hypothetical protein